MNKLQRFNCQKSNWAKLNLQWPITLFLILFCMPILFGQQTLKGKKISYSHPELATTFNAYEVHELEMAQLAGLTNGTEQEELLFNLDLGIHSWQVNLVSNPLIAPGLKTTVLTDNGVEYRDINRTYTYKGYVNGDPDSKVRMSIYDDRIIGMIKTNDDEYFIEQLATLLDDNIVSPNQYVVYKIADVVPDPSLRCGGVKAHSKSGHQEHLQGNQSGGGGSSGSILMACMEVDFALAAANDMVVRFGTVAAVQTEILDITNMMEALYDDFTLNYIVSEIVIAATLAADPWTRSQQMDELLDETDPPFDGLPGFEPWAAAGFANPHDIGQLWVNRDVISDSSGSGLIGRAGGLGVVCTPQQYNVCEYFTTSMNGLRSLSAHENGHLWDGEHGLATAGVTIMSAIIAQNATDWAAGNITQMQAHIDSRTCLGACSCDIAITGSASTDVSCAGTDDGTITITATSVEPITYSIAGPNGLAPVVTNTTGIFTGLAPGNYIARAELTSDPTCSEVVDIEVLNGPCDISIDGVTAVDESCDGAADGGITAVASYCGTFTYTLTGPNGPAVVGTNTTGIFTGLADGTYVITATSDTDATCSTMVSAEVMPGPMLLINCSNILDQNLTCRADLPPVDFNLPIIIDSCGDITLSALTIIPGNSGCPGDEITITRTYFVQDDGGNMAQCMQTFTVLSDDGPVITFCPANITLECGEDTSEATLGSATATADCSAPTITSADVVTPGCGTTSVIVRTWTATDFCNRTATCSQTITVVDNLLPVITCPASITVECDQDTTPGGGVTGVATATDVCDPAPVISSSDFIIPGDCVNEFTIERTWVATDACGNSSSCTQTIFVQDTTDPVITCPADVTIECDVDRSPATNGTATATDNCTADADIIIVFNDVIIPGPCANTFTIERTWTATDECDLFSTCLQTINVEDTTAPVAPDPPADITVQCPQDIPVPMTLTAMDNCAGPITVLPTSEITNQQCATRFTFTYTWTFDDGCGNVTAISQVIQVIDTAPLVITSSPLNQVVDCQVNVMPQEHLVEAMSPCGNPTTITSSISDPIGTLGCNGTRYIITYTVSDDCGRVVTTTQTYTIQNDGPEILCGNEICYLPCSVSGDDLVTIFNEFADIAVVLNSCEEAVTTVTNNFNPNSLGACGDVTIVTFTATDACGRTGNCTVPVIVVDDEAPTVSGPVTSAIRECDDITGLQYISWINNSIASLNATDNCGEVSVSYEPLMPNTTFEEGNPYARTEVTFTFSDECGNDLAVPGLFKLKNNHPPTFIGELEDQMIICPAMPQFDTPVFVHGCGGATLTFSDDNSGGSCPGGYTVTRTWTVTDGIGAASTIQQTIFVMGSNTQLSTVAGLIITEMDEPVEDVRVALNYSGTNFAQEEMTAEDGLYDFATPTNNDYEIQPNRNDDPLNGVTTYDLILMGQHLLDIQQLNSPYQMIAADVNKSGNITLLDMIDLRRLILHVDEEFSNNTSWRFVDAAYEFANETNPFAETFPEASMINNLIGESAADFIAVKIGDLNNSAVPNALFNGDTRSDRVTQHLLATDIRIEKGETKVLEVKAKDFTALLGYQMSLEFDPAKLEILEIIPDGLRDLTDENFGFQQQDEGIITTSWNTNHSLSLKDGTVLFKVVIKANETIRMSDVLRSSSKLTPAEAYSEIHGIMHSELVFDQAKGFEKDRFALYQNYPNPFEHTTSIGFYLDKAGDATLSVYDMNGKIRYIENGNYDKGYHEITLSREQLGGAGILYYQLNVTDRKPQIKKMVCIQL